MGEKLNVFLPIFDNKRKMLCVISCKSNRCNIMYKQRDDDEQTELPFFRPMKVLAVLCALFSAVLLIDYVLPSSCTSDKIQKRLFEKESDRFGGEVFKLHIVTQNAVFEATPAMFEDAQAGAQVEICQTQMFKHVIQISGKQAPTGNSFLHEAVPPVYKGYCAFPIALLILSLFTLFFKFDEIIAYCSGILMIVMIISVLIIL
jgi:hypothetical protein